MDSSLNTSAYDTHAYTSTHQSQGASTFLLANSLSLVFVLFQQLIHFLLILFSMLIPYSYLAFIFSVDANVYVFAFIDYDTEDHCFE